MPIQATPAWKFFEPRPNQPERFDEQLAFYESSLTGVAGLLGGNGSGTTEVAIAKIAKFVMETPPPRRDTPFWVISGTYEQTMATAWKEKLYGHEHIPADQIDWGRIHWYNSKLGWPFSVCLKEHPSHPGRNWQLVFRSYDQGRQSMQAQSIGGFCFIEQFPWGLMEEVLRGCREYNFPGSKFFEYTPVDPGLSMEVEEMLEDETKIPSGWKFFRCNTECAMEAGHVDKAWFQEFFGVVPEEMRDTRMTGSLPQFEGQIYSTWNPAIHKVGYDVVTFPTGVTHFRMIDWGAGGQHAFCCLWAYVNGLGQWTVYDEYYSTDQDLHTIDHLCNVIDRWPWPENRPHEYGVTFADPSDPERIRTAARFHQYGPRDADGQPLYQAMQIRRANNSVTEGIEHIQWLLKPAVPSATYGSDNGGGGRLEPRLVVLADACPNLCRQMRTYRWLKGIERSLNPRDPRKEPLKRDDHAVDALRYGLFTHAGMVGMTPDSIKREDKSRSRGVHLHRPGRN
jgi:hypothetical protein